ncbi:MAG: hypothetical protein AB7U83_10595 [Vicinamibacterales bacterium]
MRKTLVVAVVAAAAFSAVARGGAQAPAAGQPPQQVLPPEARYWMGATTGGGLLAMSGFVAGGRPSMAAMMKMAAGGVPTEGHLVSLKLGSTLAPQGDPEAFHTMPPGAQVNKPIYLETPEPGKSQPGAPTGYQTPKGQISFYWGCGEKAGPGQPVVLTFDKLMRGENDPELQALEGAVSARGVRTPSPGNSKTYGDWPHPDRKGKNRDLEALFRSPATLAGLHVVEGTYTPKIEFTLPADKTFMEPVRYTSTAVQASGAIALSWGATARATGYSIGVMAPEKVGDDSANIVMWSSADRPATFVVMQDLTPAEVNRLIGLKAVLPPSTTDCAVPAEVVKATRDGSMLMFTAFGDEATFIHPPRPADPKIAWDQEWFSRVNFKSVRMDMVSPQGVTDMSAMMSGGTGGGDAPGALSDEEYCRQIDAQAAAKPSVADAIPGGRLLGRLRKKPEPPSASDPRCANLKKK